MMVVVAMYVRRVACQAQNKYRYLLVSRHGDELTRPQRDGSGMGGPVARADELRSEAKWLQKERGWPREVERWSSRGGRNAIGAA